VKKIECFTNVGLGIYRLIVSG